MVCGMRGRKVTAHLILVGNLKGRETLEEIYLYIDGNLKSL
jgi:hypothetical protein